MIGTFVLVLIGCGSVIFLGYNGQRELVFPIAAAFGLAFTVMYYTLRSVADCHFNPAVTLGVCMAGRLPAKEGIRYMLFQLIGAVVGAAVLYVLAFTMGIGGSAANVFRSDQVFPAFLSEAVLTFIFVLVFLGCTSKKSTATGFAGLAVGLALVMVHIIGISITGTSVNPARSIATAVFAGGVAVYQLWLFIVAPFLGAVIASIAWRYFRNPY